VATLFAADVADESVLAAKPHLNTRREIAELAGEARDAE
jgi:hypothetical protein